MSEDDYADRATYLDSLKLCKDCSYFIPRDLYPQCKRLEVTSLVDGSIHYKTCEGARMLAGECGPNAELFERSGLPRLSCIK